MKKNIIIIQLLIIVVTIFISCSKSTDTIATTVNIDEEQSLCTEYTTGVENETIYNETKIHSIENSTNGKKNSCDTTNNNKHKTFNSKKQNSSSSSTTTMRNNDDNRTKFETTKEKESSATTKPSTTTKVDVPTNSTETTIPNATDLDGWVTKWY